MINFENEFLVLLSILTVAALLTATFHFVLQKISPRLQRWTEKTTLQWDNVFVSLLNLTRPWFVFSLIFIPMLWTAEKIDNTWKVIPVLSQVGKSFLVFASSVQMIVWGLHGIRQWRSKGGSKKAEPPSAAMGLLYATLEGLLIVSVVLIALSNLGVNIGALVTGLGIGGIAVALAAQNVLGDFLASLSIVLDKPFVIGDYIVVGSEQGEVENIGVKTTRVRSISGEELIFSNKDLLDSRIRNFKRMWRRRVAHTIRLSSTISDEKLQQIPFWVKEIFPQHEKLLFERFHLSGYGDSSLDFQLVFWVEDTDFILYMDLQQRVLLNIFSRLKKEKVDFSYPVRILQRPQAAAGSAPLSKLAERFSNKDDIFL